MTLPNEEIIELLASLDQESKALKHELLKKNPDTQKQISFFIESFMDKIHEKEIDLTSLLPPNDEEPPELTDEEIENILKQITDNSNNEK